MVVLSLVASAVGAWAQAATPQAPPEVTPKAPPPVGTPAPVFSQEPKSPRTPEGDKPLSPDNPNLAIKAVILVKTRAEIQEAGVPAANGLIIHDIPFLQQQPDFRAMVEKKFIGRQLTENAIRDLQDAIILYCRHHGKMLVDVVLPQQTVDNGVLQLWFLEGKVEKVTVKNDGKKWFKDKFILDQVHLHTGDTLDSNQLNKDLNWLNNNPFRQVDATFKPGEKLGQTDVELDVEDRIPLRPYVGYENSGTRFTGVDRLLFGLNWGNAFGLDHQFNYQYSADDDFNLVSAHSASYIAPLPWRHTLMVYGSYVDAKAQFGQNAPTADGHSWQISGRYSVPLPEIHTLRHDVSLGFDFKRSNNNLLAGGTTVQTNDTDIAQFVLGYNALLPDPFGSTSLGFEGYYSPGDFLGGNNNDADFNGLRAGAKANYVYGRLTLERLTRLPWNFSWIFRFTGQLADQRLLPSEELALGGYNTVRGYDERVVLGDNGWILNNELRTPPMELFGQIEELRGGDQFQFLAFCDAGGIHLIDPQFGETSSTTLCSVGVGARYTLSRNFSFRFDYGWPLTDRGINEHDSRAHFGILLSL